MRLYEVMAHCVRSTDNRSILAVVKVAKQDWDAFRDFIATRPEVVLLGRCPAPQGRLSVFVGCSNDGVRLKLAEHLR